MGGGRVDEKAKMPSKGPFLDLEMVGEGGMHGASWIMVRGRVWQEMRVSMYITMSNVKSSGMHQTNRRAVSKITKKRCV